VGRDGPWRTCNLHLNERFEMEMTPFDWAAAVVFALAAIWGLRAGFIDAVLTVVGLYVALLLSSQFAYRLVNFFTDDIDSRALGTAIGYVVIFIVVFVAARLIGITLRQFVKFLMLGWVDRIGGLLLGVVAGALLVSALVALAARLVYNPQSLTPIPAEEKAFRDRLHGWLIDGRSPEIVVQVRDAVPAQTLGMVPGDFDKALDALQIEIDQARP
jgi:membrane protein required for colicin V production